MTESTSLGKTQRQHRIVGLLENHGVTSQGHLVELLDADGVRATQATVSRDLEELGAVKVRVPGGDTVYAIPELAHEQRAPEDHLKRVFSDWVADVAVSGNLVVLRTPPGSAHVVGSALDRAGLPTVIGTVAGDDTLLVVVAAQAAGQDVADHLAGLAGLRPPPRPPAAPARPRATTARSRPAAGRRPRTPKE
ncbi:MAG TPA: arginine repressor [Acidimicrobiales bacterium]|jgi:transcriptional regulator of arginine metabolism